MSMQEKKYSPLWTKYTILFLCVTAVREGQRIVLHDCIYRCRKILLCELFFRLTGPLETRLPCEKHTFVLSNANCFESVYLIKIKVEWLEYEMIKYLQPRDCFHQNLQETYKRTNFSEMVSSS